MKAGRPSSPPETFPLMLRALPPAENISPGSLKLELGGSSESALLHSVRPWGTVFECPPSPQLQVTPGSIAKGAGSSISPALRPGQHVCSASGDLIGGSVFLG